MDRYTDLVKIGEGQFGEVFSAEDKLTGKMDALKKVKGSAEVMRELEALMAVKHEGIVNFKGLIRSDDGFMMLQLEYCQGGNLDTFWKKKKPDLSIKYQFMKEISESVAYLHQNDITHRDIKPENILITLDEAGNPRTKLGDFGLAKITGIADDYMTTKVGTNLFLAPEILSGKYTNKADVFSMGIVFRAMVFDRFVYLVGKQYLGDCYLANGKHPIGWGTALVNDPDLRVPLIDHKEIPNFRARSILDAMLLPDHHERPNADDVAKTIALLDKRHVYANTPGKTTPQRAQSLPGGRGDFAGPVAGFKALSLSDDGANLSDYHKQLTESIRQIKGELRAPSSMPASAVVQRSQSSRDKSPSASASAAASEEPDEILRSKQLMETKQLIGMWENLLTQNTNQWQRSQVESTSSILKQSLDKIESGYCLSDDDMKTFESAWTSMDEFMQEGEHDALFD